MGSNRRSRSRKRRTSKRQHRRRYSSSVASSSNSSMSSNIRHDKRRKSSKTQYKKDKTHQRRSKNKFDSSKINNTFGTTTPPVVERIYNNNDTSTTPVAGVNFPINNMFSTHINVIPEFDPSDGSQNVESWIHKVNECAQIYSWNDTQIRHYALAKLTGLAKRWYQGLPSLLFTWEQWTEKLKIAFPSTENYGDMLQKMLQYRCRIGQPLDVYYYEKMILINRCEILGRKAVGCLVHGIDDKFVRMSANACRFEEPEQLFSYLKTLAQSDNNNMSNRRKINNKEFGSQQELPNSGTNSSRPSVVCFNCGETGHIRTKCNKPMKRCNTCRRVGHLSKDCRVKPNMTDNNGDTNLLQITAPPSDKNVMRIQSNNSESDKFHKEININGNVLHGFIDLGSTCTLLKESLANKFFGDYEKDKNVPNLRGFGNSSVKPLGTVKGLITVDDISAQVDFIVVSDFYMPYDAIIGQTFTELPNVVLYKTSNNLRFYEAPNLTVSDIFSVKVKLNSSQDITIEPNTTSPVEVVTFAKFSGSLYVPSGLRYSDDKKFLVLPGLYNYLDGSGYIMITNLANGNLCVRKGQTIARGFEYNEITDNYIGYTTTTSQNPKPLNDINVGTQLSQSEMQNLTDLLNKYRDCFAVDLSELGKTNLTKMVIRLKDDIPVVYNPYRMSLKEKEQLSEIIEDLLNNGIIRESSSPYASPVLLVNKKNGQKRLCVDYRALNRKTLKDKYPLPRIEDKLDCLGGNSLFTSLDLASGYYQIPVAEESKHLTAFVTPDGLYEYNRMPFGLANAPSVFQRAINSMLNGVGQNLVLAYMDDLLVPSKTVQEGIEKLEKVFNLLRNSKLTLNPKKCVFFQEKIEYLGYEICGEGIRPGKYKTDAVKLFPVPKNVHEVRQFIGLASYFRKFVKDFSIIARPLTRLTKKNEPWHFGSEQIEAYNTIKEKLVCRPVLALYDPRGILEVHTDACKFGVGAILLQDSGKGLQPISYFSRQTSPEEQKFHSYELETLAVVTALNRFRVYLLGVEFKLVTDCNAVKSTMTKKDLIPRVARWWIAMQEFDFTIEYRKGLKMAHVDALSRNPVDNKDPPSRDDDSYIFHVNIDVCNIDVDDERWLQTVQQADAELQRIVEILKDPASNNIVEVKNNFTIKNGRLYRVVKKESHVHLLWAVPKSVRWQIVKSNHDDVGHFGFDKTYDRVRKVYWFKNMRRFIRKYCKSCLHCAHNKVPGGPKEGMLHPIPKPNKPFEVLHADHCGPFPQSKKGNNYILAVIDAFTKYIYIKPVKNCKSKTTINIFEEYFSLFGVPRQLITDRGTSFTSREFSVFIKEKGIKHTLNAVATPRANGQIERYNRSIVDALTAMNNGRPDNEWDTMIPKVQWGLNNTLNKATGKTPAEVLFGVVPTGASDGAMNSVVSEIHECGNREDLRLKVSERIVSEQSKQKVNFDKKRKLAHKYNVGDLVRVERDVNSAIPGQSKKLLPKCYGPYRVVRVLENDRYEVEDTPITKKNGKSSYKAIFAVDKIHPWLVFSNDPMNSDSDSDNFNDK